MKQPYVRVYVLFVAHGFFIRRFPYLVCKPNCPKDTATVQSVQWNFPYAFWGQLAIWDGKTRIWMSLESSVAVSELSSLFTLWTGVENAESSVSGLIARRWCSAEVDQSPNHRLILLLLRGALRHLILHCGKSGSLWAPVVGRRQAVPEKGIQED